jgi:hypothetical protein
LEGAVTGLLILLGLAACASVALYLGVRYLDHLEAGHYPAVAERPLRVQGRLRLYDWAEEGGL